MYLIDTNHFRRLIQGDLTIRQKIAEVGESEIAISIITQGELLYMAYNSEQQQQNLERVRAYLVDVGLYLINEAIAELYGQFKAELIRHFGPKERQKRRRTKIEAIGISDNDLWIACTAIHHSLTVVSADSDFSRMKEVKDFPVELWL
ncbi:MAG: type II toxin-antitoxin system VapC family toxin [Chroococcidiopsidaceae cyanobacterium CP_BM_ER_R8_30]|nr:type II toxin-antitoxin system VapC family toxin [Chroococcidiopsidaceae cyanobacterium CP_BM_ER_R8_30]